MDLLTSVRSAGTLAAGLVVALTGCSTADRPTAEPGRESVAEPTNGPVVEIPEPVRPDETVLGRRTGTGSARAALTGTTRDLVYVYGVCAGRRDVTLRLVTRVPSELVVPCDGVVSRMQVYSQPGARFRVVAKASAEQRWALLVTARDERRAPRAG